MLRALAILAGALALACGMPAVRADAATTESSPVAQPAPADIAQPQEPGWHFTDEGWGYWLDDGTRFTNGWLRLDDGVYYVPESGIALRGKHEIDGESYFFDPSCRLAHGWVTDQDGRYYASTSGKLLSGWQWLGSAWYWLDPATHVMATGLLEEDGKAYFMLPGGAMSTGWSWDASSSCWRHARSDGELSSGWIVDGGAWYWLDPETRAMARRTWVLDGGSWYTFADNGAMLSSTWYEDGDGWHYLGRSGAALTGWQNVSGGTFYFDRDGDANHHASYVGIREIDGKDYYFDAATGVKRNTWIPLAEGERGISDAYGVIGPQRLRNGILWLDDDEHAAGFVTIGSLKLYAEPSTGALASGWKTVAGKRYYFDPATFSMKLGWVFDGGDWYWFDTTTGAMKTGWLLEGNIWYWLGDTGAMAREWKFIEGHWYFFDSESGAMRTGVLYWNGSYYLLNSSGQMVDLNMAYPDMFIQAQAYSSSTQWLMLVDTTGCRTGIYRGRQRAWQPVKEWSCCVGAPDTPTPKGQYTVTGKGYSFGRGYTCYYYTQFWGDYLFHSILFNQGTFNVQDGRLGMQISHGCIRLPLADAKWVYDNIPYGTKVAIY